MFLLYSMMMADEGNRMHYYIISSETSHIYTHTRKNGFSHSIKNVSCFKTQKRTKALKKY